MLNSENVTTGAAAPAVSSNLAGSDRQDKPPPGANKNKVTMRGASTRNDAGELEPLMWTVHQFGLQLGYFNVQDYDRPEDAKAAAQTLTNELSVTPWVSPFITHERIIMADYGTASKIRRFVLSLYNGHAFPCDLSDISGMDQQHFKIVLELMSSYHTLGENDTAMLKLAERIKAEFEVKPVRYTCDES